MAWCPSERRVAGDDGRIERLRQSHIHGVVRPDFLAQLPRASQEIDVGVPMEIAISEIVSRFGIARGSHIACPDESPERLRHFDVYQVRRMELLLISKQAGLDPGAKRCLEKEFQQGRSVEDDHAESRSFRMTTAAAVFKA